MSNLNTLTGRTGKFVVAGILIARTTQWAVNPTQATKSEWGDSDSAGFTNRAEGRMDATSTAEGKYDSLTEVFDTFQPGDIVIETLFLDPTIYWDFPRALCDDFNLTVDIDSEEVVGWTASFGADGIFTFPGEAGQAARTVP